MNLRSPIYVFYCFFFFFFFFGDAVYYFFPKPGWVDFFSSHQTNPQDAASWYYNLDRLIQHVNADGRVKVFYSTPSKYVKAKVAESSVKWPLKAGMKLP